MTDTTAIVVAIVFADGSTTSPTTRFSNIHTALGWTKEQVTLTHSPVVSVNITVTASVSK